MKAVVLEGSREALVALARELAAPYQLFAAGEGHLLFAWGVAEDEARRLLEAGARVLVLEEEGCGKRSGSSR